jgi:hypothetical protein
MFWLDIVILEWHYFVYGQGRWTARTRSFRASDYEHIPHDVHLRGTENSPWNARSSAKPPGLKEKTKDYRHWPRGSCCWSFIASSSRWCKFTLLAYSYVLYFLEPCHFLDTVSTILQPLMKEMVDIGTHFIGFRDEADTLRSNFS